MIFTPPLYGRVLAGRKTQTRRLVASGDLATKYRVGMRKAVQKGRGVHGEGHIILTAVRREQLGAVDFEAARAEGFRTSDDFRDYWIWLHDKKWAEKAEDQSHDLYAESPEDTKSPSELMAMGIRRRFDQRWAHKQVWVLTFDLDHSERPRLLADRNARADYVESPAMALAHEPEAIDERTQEKFSREGIQGFLGREKARELDRELLLAEDRMRLVRSEARAKGVDISYLEGQIMGRVRAAERKVHGKAA